MIAPYNYTALQQDLRYVCNMFWSKSSHILAVIESPLNFKPSVHAKNVKTSRHFIILHNILHTCIYHRIIHLIMHYLIFTGGKLLMICSSYVYFFIITLLNIQNTYSNFTSLPSCALFVKGGENLKIPAAPSLAAIVIVALGAPNTDASPESSVQF